MMNVLLHGVYPPMLLRERELDRETRLFGSLGTVEKFSMSQTSLIWEDPKCYKQGKKNI
jgi:hypothetical protein